jgi:hypothetical protein
MARLLPASLIAQPCHAGISNACANHWSFMTINKLQEDYGDSATLQGH